MRARWNPWRTLREMGGAVDFQFTRLPHGVHGRSYPLPGRRAGMEIDRDLERVDRNYTCGHELIHIERRIWFPPGTPQGLKQKEERHVDHECTRRLVPLAELALFVASRQEFEPVTATLVAEEFEVPMHAAMRAMWLLGQQQGVIVD